MWRKEKAIIREPRRLATDGMFLWKVRNQAFWKSTENVCQHLQAGAVLIITTHDSHQSLCSHGPQRDTFGFIYCSPDPVIFFFQSSPDICSLRQEERNNAPSVPLYLLVHARSEPRYWGLSPAVQYLPRVGPRIPSTARSKTKHKPTRNTNR